MEEKKLTDDVIIHDLEEFAKDTEYGAIYKNALDLIHRLQSENTELKEETERLTLAVEGLTSENKVLHKENTNVISLNDALYREKAELQKQVDELKEENENMELEIFGFYEEKKQVVKDTAKEILTELKNTRFHKGMLTYDFEMAVNKLAKKYGVEVE